MSTHGRVNSIPHSISMPPALWAELEASGLMRGETFSLLVRTLLREKLDQLKAANPSSKSKAASARIQREAAAGIAHKNATA